MKTPLPFLDELKNFSGMRKVFAPRNLYATARRSGFLQRSRKLAAPAFMHLCVFFTAGHAYPTLEQMRAELRCRFGIRMSKGSLCERFSGSAVAFMREVFGQALREASLRGTFAGLGGFTDVVVADSTSLELDPRCAGTLRGSGGGASQAAAKFQWTLGLLSGLTYGAELLPGRRSDNAHRLAGIVPGALYLFDTAYVCPDNLEAVAKGGAWFVCRIRYGTALFHPDGRPVAGRALDRLVRRMRPGQYVDMDVLAYQGRIVPVRLVLCKLALEVADAIRKNLTTDKQKKRKRISEGRLAFCSVNAHLTNIGRDRMPAASLRSAYRLRWQVEVLFKALKSGMGIDKVRNIGPERFQCMFYGRLVRMLLTTRVFYVAKVACWNLRRREISEIKGLGYLHDNLTDLREWIVTKRRKNAQAIRKIWLALAETCLKDHKKGDSLPLDIIEAYA